jgi:hypothetical protein
MPRNMSFSLTTEAARSRMKDVTRRLGWANLKPGDVVQQVEKGMGLKKGEKVKKLHLIRIVSNTPEMLINMDNHDPDECRREGFPAMTVGQFIDMFCKHNRVTTYAIVNRIVFEYLD